MGRKNKNKYYKVHKDFFLTKVKNNKIKYIYFIGKNKHTMNFFNELIYENECVISKKINELLTEFNVSECEQIL